MSNSRSVLITGANGGIGRALCATFRKAGWNVIATDIQPSPQGASEQYVPADLSRFSADSSYRHGCLSQIRASLSPPSALGALINNAALQVVAPVERLSAEDWLNTCSVNVIAPFLLVQGLLADLEAGSGSIVNIGSIHAQQTKADFSAYATSKAALVGLTRSLAVELGGRVRVNAVCPAAVETPMLVAGFAGDPDGLARLMDYHPSRCIGTPDDVAAAVLMLASSPSKYLTGSIVNLDGGISSRLFDPS
jgi:NAD(P)-dependent dehydrogenase (short-subunit alcohol dehydrogenase family)